jgi:hypothetical protein
MLLFDYNNKYFTLLAAVIGLYIGYQVYSETSSQDTRQAAPAVSKNSVEVVINPSTPYSEKSLSEKMAIYFFKDKIDRIVEERKSTYERIAISKVQKLETKVGEGSEVNVQVVDVKYPYPSYITFVVGATDLSERDKFVAENIIGMKIGEKKTIEDKKHGKFIITVYNISTDVVDIVKKDSLVTLNVVFLEDKVQHVEVINLDMRNLENDFKKQVASVIYNKRVAGEAMIYTKDRKQVLLKIINIENHRNDKQPN